jgi:hypothetical protein
MSHTTQRVSVHQNIKLFRGTMLELLRRLIWNFGTFFVIVFTICGLVNIASLVLFISAIFFILSESYIVWAINREINYSQGIMKVLFFGKRPKSTFWNGSLISSKGLRKFWLWTVLVLSILCIIWYIVFVLVLKLPPPYFVP